MKFPKQKVNEFHSHIVLKGRITSKIYTYNFVDDLSYSFRLSYQLNEKEVENHTVKIYDKSLIENLSYGDTITVDGFFIQRYYQSKDKETIKVLKTIYCNTLEKEL